MSSEIYSNTILSTPKRKIAKKDVKSFYMFFLTALFGASVNFISRIFYKPLFLELGYADQASYSYSIYASYLTATLVSFVPAKIFAFDARQTGNTKRETLKFLFIAIVALIVQESISVFVYHNIANTYFGDLSQFLRETGSHVVGMGFSFIANFFGHRLITFRSTGLYEKIRSRG